MGYAKGLLGAAVIAAMSATGVTAASANSFMPLGGMSSQPVGHYDFCQRHRNECKPISAAAPVELTRDLWELIVAVNNKVNIDVFPRTDWEMWGIEEYWSYPVNGMGDCEDYALEKRKLLAQAGIPLSNLAVTVVRQPNGDGHAVLTVRTSMGDFILDNLEPRVLSWTETDYRYIKRQAPKHAGMWVSIDDDRDMLVGSID
jgi:predicted transglutaminase-like cysteine proteinase